MSFEMSPERRHAEKEVVEAAFDELEATSKPVLLLLDEVQHLATDSSFGDFTASLRSFMTARSDNKIKGIFTGSSQEGLTQLFKRTKAPLYNASSTHDFPDLDEDFVKFELDVFKRVTGGVVLDPVQAMSVFESLSRAPGRFTDLLKRMALEAIHDVTQGASLFIEVVLEEDNAQFCEMWDSLLPLDKAILIMMARGQCRGLYGVNYKASLESLCPKGVTCGKSAIQNAVTRLKGANVNAIYSIEHGVWDC